MVLIIAGSPPVRCANASENGAGADLVQGDAALLEMLHGAQLNNRARFPSGNLTASADGFWDGESFKLRADVVWSPAATYWEYEFSRGQSHERCRMIDDGRMLFCYWPETRFLQRIADHRMSHAEQLALRPDQIWYRLEGLAGGEWANLLDRKRLVNAPSEPGVRVAVTRLDDNLIQVDRLYAEAGTMRIVASLADNGNIVDYEVIPGKASSIWGKGHYEWSAMHDGASVLKTYTYERALDGNKRKPDRTFNLTIQSFEPTVEIAADRFLLSSLGVPDNATVQDVSASGTRTYRQSKPMAISDEILLELSRSLRQRGFAVSERDK